MLAIMSVYLLYNVFVYLTNRNLNDYNFINYQKNFKN